VRISTGLKPIVKRQVIPMKEPVTRFFRPEVSYDIPNPSTAKQEVYIIEFHDENDPKTVPQTMISGDHPIIHHRGTNFVVTEQAEEHAEDHEAYVRRQYNVPDDAIKETSQHDSYAITTYTLKWWEIDF